MNKEILSELQNWVTNSLLELIHPNLRCVSIDYSNELDFTIYFIVDRPKIEFDEQVAELFFETFLSHASSNNYFRSTEYKILYHPSKIDERLKFSYFAFKRMEQWVNNDGSQISFYSQGS